jgi:hypothetical protein
MDLTVSNCFKSILSVMITLSLSDAVNASGPQWWQNIYPSSNNTQVDLKDANNNTVNVLSNPTAANVRVNANNSSQQPSIIIQATSSNQVFSYKDDCYVFDLAGHAGSWFIGAGKVDTSTTPNKFTGVLGYFNSNTGYYQGGAQVMSALLGSGFSGTATYASGNPKWCGADDSCAWNYGYGTGTNTYLVGAALMPVNSYQKCYP